MEKERWRTVYDGLTVVSGKCTKRLEEETFMPESPVHLTDLHLSSNVKVLHTGDEPSVIV